jgi:hypothetical protein
MDKLLGTEGQRIPDGPTTQGRGKVVWDLGQSAITYEQHPYHPGIPGHSDPHWHLDTPENPSTLLSWRPDTRLSLMSSGTLKASNIEDMDTRAGGAFLAYVGDPDLHDGSILEVVTSGEEVSVLVRGHSGRLFRVRFPGSEALRSKRPEGMLLHGLAETKTDSALRHFVFVNWHENDDAALELSARDFVVEPAR